MKFTCQIWPQLVIWNLFFERCCIILKRNKGCPLHIVNFCDPNSNKKVVNFLNKIIQPYNKRVKIYQYFRDGNQ